MKKRFTVALFVLFAFAAVSLSWPAPASAQPGQSLINEERMLAEFIDMLKIRSQGKNERQFADTLKAKLTELGGEVYEDEAYKGFGGNTGNIFAYFKGTVAGAPVMMLNAHIDTVEPSEGVVPQIVDGIIKPSGKTILGADNKAGVSCIIEALRTIKEQNIPHADLLVLFTVSEDVALLGSKHVDQAMLRKADFGFALDGGGRPGDIVFNAPGANRIKIVINGKASHAGSAPEKGINAIAIAGKGLAVLKQGRIDDETTSNVGTIQGGVATNIIADRCEMMAEARSRDTAKLDFQTKYIGDTFVKAAADNGAKAEITLIPLFAPFKLDMSATPIKLAQTAMDRSGLKANIRPTGGGSDANFFNAYGLPTAILGLGNANAHTYDENIAVADLYKSANMVVTLIQAAAELKK